VDTLLAALPASPNVENEDRARYLRSLAIIRLRLTELGIAHEEAHTSSSDDLKRLETSVSRALTREPADAYLWLVLSWLRSKAGGQTEASLAALRMSYLCGPNEGWVAVLRNRFVLSFFSSMPPAIQDSTLQEFRVLVSSGYANQTATIFVGAASPIRDRLLEQIKTVPVDAKREFAAALYQLDSSLTVPGVSLPGARRHEM
jgi:hypothetical protein